MRSKSRSSDYKNVVIPASPSAGLSTALDTGGYIPEGLVIPAAFTGGSLTFQASVNGEDYGNLYYGGVEAMIGGISGGRQIALNSDWFEGVRYLKLRSGTSGNPKFEAAARTIGVALRGE